MPCYRGRDISSLNKLIFVLGSFLVCSSLNASPWLSRDLTELSLDELLDINVRLTTRRGESLGKSPAAVYVLTHDAIRRSGATSVPELLRLVPGVEVTRFGTGKWGVGIRGFNGGIFTNRLLILVDGRSVFSQAKVGMFWDTLDTLIPDIARIEVVRGPGAALWGSNAFNGVINIVTSHGQDSLGGIAELAAGDEEKWFANGRYGTKLGDDGYIRGYIKSFERDEASRPDGSSNHDRWTGTQAGMRFDHGNIDSGATSIQINAYEGDEGEELDLPDFSSPTLAGRFKQKLHYSGMNAVTHWQQRLDDKSDVSVRLTMDHSKREDLLFNLNINSYDLDFQHDYSPAPKHRLVWGLSYRHTSDELKDQHIRFTPVRRSYGVASGFAQYEHDIRRNLRLIAGSKVEQNDFTGRELQPNLRALWSPASYGSFWLAASKASRTPSRTEHDSIIDFDLINPFVQLQIRGSKGFKSEELTAHEFGWRRQFGDHFNVDLALFYNEYDGLRTLELSAPEPSQPVPGKATPPFTVPLLASNEADARSWGGELMLTALWHTNWHMEFQYSQVQIHVDPGSSTDPNVENAEGESPLHRATIRSFWNLPNQVELSATVRYVDEVERQNIDEYTELDLVLSKRFNRNIRLSLVGQNLLDNAHEEYVDRVVGTPRVENERGAYLKLSVDF